MRAAAFPLVALAAGALGVAAAWTRPGRRLGPDGASASVLVVFGVAAMLGVLPFGFDQASWHAFGRNAAALAVASALTAGWVKAARPAVFCAAALAVSIVAATAGATAVNPPDAVALAATCAAVAVTATAVVTIAARLVALGATTQHVTRGALALVATWFVTQWFDPVLLTRDGQLLPPRAAFPAAAAGVLAGAALQPLRVYVGPRMAHAVTLVACLATLVAATYVAGRYGAGLALVPLAFLTAGALTARVAPTPPPVAA